MAKLTLSDLANLNNQTSAVTTINNNSAAIETAIENTLSRDGTSPNQMGADLDLNGFDVINVGNIFVDGDVIEADVIADFVDWNESSAPASPSANTARMYAVDEGGVTRLVYKDSAGNINNMSVEPTDSLSVTNLTQTGYSDSTEIVEPSSPSANTARMYAYDESSTTRLAYKDSAGTVNKFSSTSAATTDNAITRFDGTTGLLQNSNVTVNDSGVVTGASVTPGTSNSTARTLEARTVDLLTLKDFGAVGDGTTNDTTAVTNADATAGPIYVPRGTYDTTISQASLVGPFWGKGQIRDSANNLRGPWFSAISAAPTVGDQTSVLTAFNGDLSGVQIAMEHRVSGAATAGQPATGYMVKSEISPIFMYHYTEAGHNESTDSNDGRTGQSMLNLNFAHTGQGDMGGLYINGIVTGTKAGATSFLASPAAAILYGQLFAGATGAYMNVIELNSNDNGFQAAAVGAVFNFNRTVATATLGEVWMGLRPQSSGSTPPDVVYSVGGDWKRGLDLTPGTFTSEAAITLKADQRIYVNSVASGDVAWSQALGDEWMRWRSDVSAWEFAVNGNARLLVSDGAVIAVGALTSSASIGGIGYTTGAGGTVTQLTSKATAVTINRPTGRITMHNASLGAGAVVDFGVINSTYVATSGDTVIAHHSSGGTTGGYSVQVLANGTNTFVLRVTNLTGGALAEAIVINYNVIKGATS